MDAVFFLILLMVQLGGRGRGEGRGEYRGPRENADGDYERGGRGGRGGRGRGRGGYSQSQ